jgi:multidrug resistance efflux pump
MKRFVLPLVAVASLLFAVSWTLAERPVRKPSIPPAPPPETSSAQTVAAVGLVEPGTENIALSCAVSGLVTSLSVKAGDRVRSGQKLFSIDDRDLLADLAAKRAALDNARAQLAKLEAQPRPEELHLERLTTRAPMEGVILQNKVRLGQYAQCGPLAEPLMTFGGGRELHVRADVDEEDAWRVKAGAPATAHVRGNSTDRHPLEFVRFEPYVIAKQSLTGAATERVDTRVLQVIYRFRDRNASVFDGQQMDVFIGAAPPQGGAR